MIRNMYAIRDQAAEVYNLPFAAHTHGEAERNFAQLVNDPKSTVYAYPEHFELTYIGQYDDQKGQVLSLDTPQHICRAVQLKREQ